MLTGYYQKNKERLSKNACERHQNLSKEKKTKGTNMLVSDIEIFLKKKKKSVNMVVNDLKIFWRMKNRGLLSI